MSNLPSNLANLDLQPLPGSERAPAPDVTAVGPVDPDSPIAVTLVLRRRAEVPEEALTSPISPAEFAAKYGADPADLDLVTQTLSSLGVAIVEADAASRRIRISGPASLLGQIFGTEIEQVSSSNPVGGRIEHRHRSGGLSVPGAISGVVTAILGLDDRPQTVPRFQIARSMALTTSYTPIELGKIYNFPEGTDGSGQSIAIIELGGGFDQADLDTYFSSLGITGPQVTAVGVDGATNVPGQDPDGADGEVLLDIEVAGALAPKASIVVYFAPNTDAGFIDAISHAAHANPTPAAISISWGQCEDDWTQQARTAFDEALTDAAVLGVTVTVAAGDDGSTDRAADGKVHVDFPAASPHALACGGTRLQADPSTGKVTSETVWNNGVGAGATGGGVSRTFGLPSWQATVGVSSVGGRSGRGVPDVAGVADPQTGYRIRVDGRDIVIGGTSAVSPLWAALIARLVQATGRKLGLVQPALYGATTAGQVPPGFRDVTQGNNGAYQAAPGWDPCTGLGVPDGAQLLAALQSSGKPSAQPATGE
jgi:kumamolisin